MPMDRPAELVVSRVRDGRRFAHRRVEVQDGERVCCELVASFAAPADGAEYQEPPKARRCLCRKRYQARKSSRERKAGTLKSEVPSREHSNGASSVRARGSPQEPGRPPYIEAGFAHAFRYPTTPHSTPPPWRSLSLIHISEPTRPY